MEEGPLQHPAKKPATHAHAAAKAAQQGTSSSRAGHGPSPPQAAQRSHDSTHASGEGSGEEGSLLGHSRARQPQPSSMPKPSATIIICEIGQGDDRHYSSKIGNSMIRRKKMGRRWDVPFEGYPDVPKMGRRRKWDAVI